jgi:hypothetical protein
VGVGVGVTGCGVGVLVTLALAADASDGVVVCSARSKGLLHATAAATRLMSTALPTIHLLWPPRTALNIVWSIAYISSNFHIRYINESRVVI